MKEDLPSTLDWVFAGTSGEYALKDLRVKISSGIFYLEKRELVIGEFQVLRVDLLKLKIRSIDTTF